MTDTKALHPSSSSHKLRSCPEYYTALFVWYIYIVLYVMEISQSISTQHHALHDLPLRLVKADF